MSTTHLGIVRSQLEGIRSHTHAAWQAAENVASQARERHNAVGYIYDAALDLPDGGSDEVSVQIARIEAALLLISTLDA